VNRFRAPLFLPICLLPILALFADSPAAAADDGELPPPAKKQIDFARDVLPIFAKHCLKCHGADKQESGFRLDRKAAALAGGDSGAAVKPGDSAGSLLIEYTAALDPDFVMPPEGDPLSKAEVGILRAWIDQGAKWPDESDAGDSLSKHWSYQPLTDPAVPQTRDASWPNNPIDNFVLAQLESRKIPPSPEADRYTLIRRLSLDLLGLPPTPAEVDEFVNDSSPEAYENLVDRLLQSPNFGERWGRHWLDKARYADSDGYEKDRPRPNAWRYRDWVIDAINRDLPFDQFTIEQLAGDLLPDATPMQRLATAFHRQTLTNTEGGTDQEEFRVEATFDRVETTGLVWLGLTVGCARCHSHKYDEITQREYFQLFAFMNNADEVNNFSVPISEERAAKYDIDKSRHDQAVAALQKKLKAEADELGPALAAWERDVQKELSSADTIRFHPLDDVNVTAGGGVTFKQLDDGSFLASGKNPDSNTYTIEAVANLGGVTGFRLEVLAHDSLPAKGPGRVAHGNFVLNHFKAELLPADGETPTPLNFQQAEADFAQNSWPVANAIDGKPETGWAVSPQMGQDHWATFILAEPVSNSGSAKFRIVLDHKYGKQHTIGRFRILAMTGTKPGGNLPETIRAILAVAPDKRTGKQQQSLLDYYAGIHPATSDLVRELDELKQKAPKPPVMDVAVLAERTKNPRMTYLLRRGDFLQPLTDVEVQPGGLSVLPPLGSRASDAPADRLDLAHWLMDARNPLTPRVAVNQIWSHLFGRGIVATVGDFGVRGEQPSHPELLDWLAGEYRRLNWSRKALIKRIVMSATYRQSSAHRPELADVDPRNIWLYRQNRFRVEGEIIRDASLAAGGLLSRKVGGPSVFPPMPADVAALSYANNFKWATSPGDDKYRRGMYTFFKRTSPHPNLLTFDCPDSNTTCIERNTSNTPLQALTTLNNEVFVEASQSLARLVLTETPGPESKTADATNSARDKSALQNVGTTVADAAPAGGEAVSGEDAVTDADRLTRAFRRCVARPPTQVEQTRLFELLEASRDWYSDRPDDAKKLVGDYQPQGAPIEEAAAWTAVARILLNLDEFVTRE
jgi:hypothetical protein